MGRGGITMNEIITGGCHVSGNSGIDYFVSNLFLKTTRKAGLHIKTFFLRHWRVT